MNKAELIKERTKNILRNKETNVKNLQRLLQADLKKLLSNYLIFDEDNFRIFIDEKYSINITVTPTDILDFGKFIE